MAGQGIGPDLQNVKIEANSMWDPKMHIKPGIPRAFSPYSTAYKMSGVWDVHAPQVVCSMLCWPGEGLVSRLEGQDFCCDGS